MMPQKVTAAGFTRRLASHYAHIIESVFEYAQFPSIFRYSSCAPQQQSLGTGERSLGSTKLTPTHCVAVCPSIRTRATDA